MTDIIKAVGSAIGRLGECVIYSERLPQGFKAPCFFIREVKRSRTRVVGDRFRERAQVEVAYYPKDKLNAREECYAVSNAMFELMELVRTEDGLIRGVEKRSEVENGTLKFFVTFELFTVSRKSAEMMERLEYASRANGRG